MVTRLEMGATLASPLALPTGSEEDSAGQVVVLGPYRVRANHWFTFWATHLKSEPYT